MDKVITALDYAKREGCANVRERIQKICNAKIARNVMDRPAKIDKVKGKKVYAELNYGQWIARCECGGAEAVDPSDAVFFCFSCGNYSNNGALRPVVFPNNIKDIEKEVMKRPIRIGVGTHEIERLTLATPEIYVDSKGFLSRSWVPGESVEDIKEQNKIGGLK